MDVIFYGEDHSRARLTAIALEIAMRAHGDTLSLRSLKNYNGRAEGDVAVVFGIRSFARQVVASYRAAGKPFLIMDKGYTRRKSLGFIEHNVYWRVGVGQLHSIFSAGGEACSSDRFARLGITLQPLAEAGRDGHVLILPPARKIFLFLGLGDLDLMQSYFAKVAQTVIAATDKNVRFRGKTEQGRWQFALEMSERCSSCLPGQAIKEDLAGTACAITHTTSAGINALIAGVPIIELGEGVVRPLAEIELGNIGDPRRYTEEERRRFLYWLAYQQWTLAELASGEAWAYLRPQIL